MIDLDAIEAAVKAMDSPDPRVSDRAEDAIWAAAPTLLALARAGGRLAEAVRDDRRCDPHARGFGEVSDALAEYDRARGGMT